MTCLPLSSNFYISIVFDEDARANNAPCEPVIQLHRKQIVVNDFGQPIEDYQYHGCLSWMEYQSIVNSKEVVEKILSFRDTVLARERSTENTVPVVTHQDQQIPHPRYYQPLSISIPDDVAQVPQIPIEQEHICEDQGGNTNLDTVVHNGEVPVNYEDCEAPSKKKRRIIHPSDF